VRDQSRPAQRWLSARQDHPLVRRRRCGRYVAAPPLDL